MAQQENNQAMILQQPNKQKVYLDLNHSTDTTAIWSFIIAMIVALILGISATIIAIWYGRKSFKLTEMSFKVVSEDIKQAAETNRQTTKTLIESQENLKDKELKVLRKQNIEDKFSDVISKYLSSANLFTHTLSNIIFNLKEEEWENFNQKKVFTLRLINW
ncbi:YccF domain-containing protein [Acinetobacter terrestris]|uniref:YccF domain-containing protein n=1 Tax=Acinetobacter terrestris TaxID=2529843 RepID=A0AAW6UWS7_9GAMM|nr:YccF domain-containing protein [Acinetobacter terrestris]MDK1683912.1 YccF domain-containing protein [Acinetobacter terrestris]